MLPGVSPRFSSRPSLRLPQLLELFPTPRVLAQPTATATISHLALTSTAPQTHRSYRRHPSSPPTDVCSHRESAYPPPSNLHPSALFPTLLLLCQLDPGAQVPSAGKSSNSSSSSSCAAGFFSAAGSPFLDLSSVTALVVAAEPCAAPDIVAVGRGEGVSGRGVRGAFAVGLRELLMRCGSDGGDRRGRW